MPESDRTDSRKPWWRLSLSQAVMVGLILGVGAGVFFGESCNRLGFIGDAFIRLLQMTILPYIVISLIANIGGLKPTEAKTLAGRITALLLVFWAMGLLMVYLMPLALPQLTTASFFSTSSVTPPEQVDFLSLYIPANPFRSLANDVIPAAVLFSIATGVALIHIEKKQGLIDQMQIIADALIRVSNFVARLTPVGVFAISASAAGSMTIGDLERIQAYIILYTAGALLLTFWVLPAAVAILTPFKYRDVLRHSKEALVIAFTTANVFIALPLMITAARNLFEEYDFDVEESSRTYEVVLPIVFSFPNVGKLLMMVFIPFAGWFTGQPLDTAAYPMLLASGLLSFFGSTATAVPFLLDLLRIPADMFDLFMVTGIIIGRIASIGAIIHLVALSLLVACMTVGRFKIRPGRLLVNSAVTVVVLAASIVGMRLYLGSVLDDQYTKDRYIKEMQVLVNRADEVLYLERPENLEPIDPAISRLEQILNRGYFRAAYIADRIPWCYFNADGKLVGFDIDLAHRLATELGVAVQFIPADEDSYPRQLASGEADVIFAGLPVTAGSLARLRFTDPHLELMPCLVVADHKRHLFADARALKNNPAIRLGVTAGKQHMIDYYLQWVSRQLPLAEQVPVDSLKQYFEDEQLDLDGVFMSAEAGYAWTLLYPQYGVVIPPSLAISVPIAYPVADDERLAQFFSHWVNLKVEDGTVSEIYNHWVLGQQADEKQPRWSVIRDVLGWVD